MPDEEFDKAMVKQDETNWRIGVQRIRDVLQKYLLPDCLKPEFDGTSLWEIAEKCLETQEPNYTDPNKDQNGTGI